MELYRVPSFGKYKDHPLKGHSSLFIGIGGPVGVVGKAFRREPLLYQLPRLLRLFGCFGSSAINIAHTIKISTSQIVTILLIK